VQTVNLALTGIDTAGLQNRLLGQAGTATAMVREAGLPMTAIDIVFEADMHYLGQTHTIAVTLPDPRRQPVDEAGLQAAFEAAYEKNFGRVLPPAF
jgi:N-methylhydantoinase A